MNIPRLTRARFIALACASILLSALIPQSRAAERESMIFQAIRRGDDALLASLLQAGSSPDTPDANGTTPLMIAALHGDAETVRLLLDHGADPKAANRDGVTALLWGAGDAEKVRLLLEHGADPHARSRLGRTPLDVAAGSPDGAASVEQLLAAGADPDANATLAFAADAGSRETLGLLLGAGAGKGLDRALHIAARLGFDEAVETLLQAGADPDWTPDNDRGGQALHVALLGEHVPTAQMLLEHGAGLTDRLQSGEPPIMLATYTERGDDTILRAILERQADLSVSNHREETALTWARKRGHAPLVKMLEDRGATGPDGEPKEVPTRDIAFHAGNAQSVMREAVSNSLALMAKSSEVFLRNRESCVSCHHQNLPSMAFGLAREKGFRIEASVLDHLIERQQASWEPRMEQAYQMADPVPVPPRFLGWGMLGWAALGYEPDAITDAMAWYLRETQQREGYWPSHTLRPPMGGNEMVSTALALRSLQLYPPPGKPLRTEVAIEQARGWLLQQNPQTLQERLSHLLGLAWTGSTREELQTESEAILKLQRNDGGWAQLPGLESDAWATGQTLYALRVARAVETNEPVYLEGLRFLLNTQFEDGSWYVASRTWPFQPHFDSAFPHGKDQWISVAGTAWAVMAMVLAIDPLDAATAAALEAGATLSDAAGETVLSKPQEPLPSAEFAAHVKPLLERSCVSCHSGETPKGSFRVTDRESLMRGGESGHPAVVPGDLGGSQILRLVSDEIEDMEMPPPGKRDRYPALSPEEIRLLAGWIQNGAAWPEAVRLEGP